MCLSKKSPITNCVAIPGRPPSLYSGAISPSMNSQSILPASCTSSCLMLMIWSSRARNKSPDPVVSCFLGRIAPSDAATESCFSIRGNGENEIASFQGLRHANLAISSQQSRRKTTLAQWVRSSSRATHQCRFDVGAGRGGLTRSGARAGLRGPFLRRRARCRARAQSLGRRLGGSCHYLRLASTDRRPGSDSVSDLARRNGCDLQPKHGPYCGGGRRVSRDRGFPVVQGLHWQLKELSRFWG